MIAYVERHGSGLHVQHLHKGWVDTRDLEDVLITRWLHWTQEPAEVVASNQSPTPCCSQWQLEIINYPVIGQAGASGKAPLVSVDPEFAATNFLSLPRWAHCLLATHRTILPC